MTKPDSPEIFNIQSTFVVCDNQGDAIPLPVTEPFWQDLDARFGTFAGKSLISCFRFEQDWPTWEMHPAGEEFVCLLSGEMEFFLEIGGEVQTTLLQEPESFVIIPAGTWHTANVRSPFTMLFVTPGEGTQNRPVN
jgi:uncharacterized cupin superfamily protein